MKTWKKIFIGVAALLLVYVALALINTFWMHKSLPLFGTKEMTMEDDEKKGGEMPEVEVLDVPVLVAESDLMEECGTLLETPVYEEGSFTVEATEAVEFFADLEGVEPGDSVMVRWVHDRPMMPSENFEERVLEEQDFVADECGLSGEFGTQGIGGYRFEFYHDEVLLYSQSFNLAQ